MGRIKPMPNNCRRNVALYLSSYEFLLRDKEKVPYYHFNNLNLVARAMGVTVKQAEQILSNGSAASNWAEHQSTHLKWQINGQIYSASKVEGQQVADVELKHSLNAFDVGVRCYNGKADLNPSGDKGIGRKRSWKTLVAELKQLKFYILCDVSDPHYYVYYLFETASLLKLMMNNMMGLNGMATNKFHKIISEFLGYRTHKDLYILEDAI